MDEPNYDYRGPEELRVPVQAALQRVIDPEVGLDIVAMGLVYVVEIEPGVARVDMTMTSAACPVADVLAEDVERQLCAVLPQGSVVQIELVWEPMWTPDRLSASARDAMGW